MFITLWIIIMLVAIVVGGLSVLRLYEAYTEAVEDLNNALDENVELKRIIVENNLKIRG